MLPSQEWESVTRLAVNPKGKGDPLLKTNVPYVKKKKGKMQVGIRLARQPHEKPNNGLHKQKPCY